LGTDPLASSLYFSSLSLSSSRCFLHLPPGGRGSFSRCRPMGGRPWFRSKSVEYNFVEK
jgi:hypothetical protein